MVITRTFEIRTPGHEDLLDITGQVERLVRSGGMPDGVATVFIPGCSVALATAECEGGELAQARSHFRALWDMALEPQIKVTMLGTSLMIPFQRGNLALSTWQRVVLVDMGLREQWHHVTVQLLGDKG